MAKNTIKFAMYGNSSSVLELTRNHLILSGFELVPLDSNPDFVLVDALQEVRCLNPQTPVLLFSSDAVYSDRGYDLAVRDKTPMAEDEPILICSPLEDKMDVVIQLAKAERHYMSRHKHCACLRIFNVFGPSIREGLISKLFKEVANGGPLFIHSPGYQIRTYLYETDYLEIISRFIDKFVSGTAGIFNIGSTETVSVKRLAESVCQLADYGKQVTPDIVLTSYPMFHRWWVIPDTTRVSAIVDYTPTKSLRSGLWEMSCERQRST